MFLQIKCQGETFKTKSVRMSKSNAKKVAEDIKASLQEQTCLPKMYETLSGFLVLSPEVIKQALFEVVVEYDDLYVND